MPTATERRRLISLLVVLAVVLTGAPTASAVVAYNASGHFWGVAPRQGVAPASIPGSLASRHGLSPLSTNGNLGYHGGSVLHSSTPYLVFWDPSGSGISTASRALLERYFTDVAADGGHATNVYAVARQFTDGSGFADYRQTFSAGSQAIIDIQPYPAPDTTNCPVMPYPSCVTDLQLTTELKRLVAADGLPAGTGTGAPIYFIVTPGDVNVCQPLPHGRSQCASNVFCAYHSSVSSGSSTLLYASIPMLNADLNPKSCQADQLSAVQEPNGDPADVAIKYMSHEDNETITDPLGTGWFDASSGNEDGDNCNITGSLNPLAGTNPNAFLPTLGGSSVGTSSGIGTLFDQQIDGNPYYIQSEWSNGDINCELRPSAGTLSPSFTTPGPVSPRTSAAFDPSASSSSNGYSSATWSFGDGSAPVFKTGAPTPTSHTFATPGLYVVSLTLVDTHGNLVTTTNGVPVGSTPTATFTSATGTIALSVGLDASGSSDPNSGGSISSYSWSFGDGSTASGPAPTHTYVHPGGYTVWLTVTDNYGLTASVSHQLEIGAPVPVPVPVPALVLTPPSPAFVVRTAHPASGVPVLFDASSSSDPGAATGSYAWTFGDGTVGSGETARHVYAASGDYRVTLTIIDGSGQTASVTEQVTVAAAERIRRIALDQTRLGAWLVLRLDGPGTLYVGSHQLMLVRARTVSFKLELSSSQRGTLHRRHRLRVKLAIRFVPVAGNQIKLTKTVTLRS